MRTLILLVVAAAAYAQPVPPALPAACTASKTTSCTPQVNSSGGYVPPGAGGGATIPSTTHMIKGDGAGNGADSKVVITAPATLGTIQFAADNETVVLPGGTLVPNSRTVCGHALSGNVTCSPSDVSLGSVTNDAQTKAAVMPNTAPSSAQIPIGTGSAYVPQTMSGDCTISASGVEICLHVVTFTFDGGGSAISTGACGQFPSTHFSGTIFRTDISADQAGSFTLDVWKHSSGTIPGSGDKISASAPVTLSSAQLDQNGSISGWTTAVAADDVWGCTVATAATVTKVTVQIWMH